MDRKVNVLVVGGGPGGSTAAALLAKAGLDVLLLERENFPRYHIGESLLASCLPTLRLSGAFDAVAEQGFTVKRGALFHWAEDVWELDWEKLVDPNAWSYQVDRATYDDVLLRNATAQGAEVIEGALVKRIEFEGDRPVAAEWTRRGDSTVNTVRFDHIIDASGRAGVLSQQHLGLRQQHEIFQNIAIWSYWDNATLLPNSPKGGINVVSCPDGWWWHIPLKNGRFSTGLVTHKDKYAAEIQRFESLDAYYLDRLHASPAIASVIKDATRAAGTKVDQDYSYVSDRFCGPGFFLVGDAACFLDPLLSTGVHLAQYSAMLAAAAIMSTSRNEVSETEGLKFYEVIYRRAYTRMLVLVSRLYEQYKGKDDYFWGAQQLVHEKNRNVAPVRSFTAITTGLTDMAEATLTETRVLNQQLISEAEAVQDAKAAQAPTENLHSLDVTATWGPWRSLVGADTSTDDLALVVEPALGIGRRRVAVAVA
jgi:flavin-dependent dehydrogenase